MGLFDFIFNSKKKEQERLRLEEEERRQRLEQERIAQERESRLEENRRKERERLERLKAEREQAESVQPFTFQSNCHQRYENDSPVQGLQDCIRTVSVVKNTNGCPGYRIQPGIGYIVKIYNDDLGKPNMSDKPMKVVRKTADMLELRGFPIEAQTPSGWQEVDYRDYGFIVYYKEGKVDKCVLHMYDRNVRIEYMKKEQILQYRESCFKENSHNEEHAMKTENYDCGNNKPSKELLEEIIHSLAKLSYMFRDSVLLTQKGRNTTMMSRLFSYTGMMGYLYEYEYKYGSFNSLVDTLIADHYKLVLVAMSNPSHKNKSLAELASNWSDVLQVLFNLSLENNPDKVNFEKVSDEVTKITHTFERLSGKKCKQPSDPRKVTPRKVTYNPLNITEDLQLSQGHVIPDITNVFAQELIPQLTSHHSTKASKDIVAEYTLAMIKSYYDNAGFVPMVIVDQITGQINQVTEMVQRISYSPYPSLKEYVLSKIYN